MGYILPQPHWKEGQKQFTFTWSGHTVPPQATVTLQPPNAWTAAPCETARQTEWACINEPMLVKPEDWKNGKRTL